METPARGSGVRRYGMEDVRRLRFIRQAQAAGFSLDEIAELIALDAGRDRARARELARDKIGALDAKIAELTGARTALQRLARECAASDDGRSEEHTSEPQSLMRISYAGACLKKKTKEKKSSPYESTYTKTCKHPSHSNNYY